MKNPKNATKKPKQSLRVEYVMKIQINLLFLFSFHEI